MSQLAVAIVGLPNVGKSTLFNALLARQQAYVANFPFATIEPNIGVVPVPDIRLKKLAEVVNNTENMDSLPPEVPSTVEFVDVAGLIAGAHKGEGLGNKFLSHIRETDAVCHVVRAFSDPNIIKEGVTDPKTDFETVETELKLADLQTVENQNLKVKKQNCNAKFKSAIDKLYRGLQKNSPAREADLDDQEVQEARQLTLLTAKPVLVVLNVDEDDLRDSTKLELKFAQEVGVHSHQVIAISAKVESELTSLSESDQKTYLVSLGVKESGLERLITKAFETLGLITFLTAGVKEVRAWTVPKNSRAQDAAGVIHTDFVKNFIKADVVDYKDFISLGWKRAREEGKVRSEGKDYILHDGEVVEFKIGS